MAAKKAGAESGGGEKEKDLIGEKIINIKSILAAESFSFPKNPENFLKPILTGSLKINFP
jgi:hypothetical protein